MTTESRTVEQVYDSAIDSALVVRHDPPGMLLAYGADRLDLLHRMSTNELETLEIGGLRQTVFTDPVGRTIDVVTVLQQPDHSVLLGLPGRAERLRSWLQRHIFFQDQVTLSEPESEWSLWGVYGPLAVEIATELGANPPAPERFESLGDGYCWPVSAPLGGLLLLTSSTEIESRLAAQGGEALDRQAYEILRVEAGVAAPDREILDDSIPLEVGLRPAISFSKGCYVGQEIIARMDSRERLAKQLVGLRFGGAVEPGSSLEHDGRKVGQVTSAAYSPRHGWVGIGSVRSEAIELAALTVAGMDTTAELVEFAVLGLAGSHHSAPAPAA
jgi:aminomethyltransferase